MEDGVISTLVQAGPFVVLSPAYILPHSLHTCGLLDQRVTCLDSLACMLTIMYLNIRMYTMILSKTLLVGHVQNIIETVYAAV